MYTIALDLQVVPHGMVISATVLQEHMMTATKIAFQREIIVRILYLVQHPVHQMAKKIHGNVFVTQDITGRIGD
jgi:hypothetical protein